MSPPSIMPIIRPNGLAATEGQTFVRTVSFWGLTPAMAVEWDIARDLATSDIATLPSTKGLDIRTHGCADIVR